MNTEKKSLSWGKPLIEIAKLGADGKPGEWKKIPTPVQDSTQLTTTPGDKMEAPVEGGANEAVMYKQSTYTFEFELRVTSQNFEKPMEDFDGVIADEYAVRLTPQIQTAKGILIDRCAFSAGQTYDTTNGEKIKYTADVLAPYDSSRQIKPYTATETTKPDPDPIG